MLQPINCACESLFFIGTTFSLEKIKKIENKKVINIMVHSLRILVPLINFEIYAIGRMWII